ncbi:MAG TPA: Uma2 family endonuclease [Rhodospirillales bacterium]|nr:Uma2 family endonuclease [Rhodospirillales bacterium]
MAFAIKRHRLTVADFLRMAEAGILRDGDRVELIDGEIVNMPPTGAAHAGTPIELTRLFTERAGPKALVSVRNPLRLGEDSMPQPDLALLRPRPDGYRTRHPGPEDVLLLVEVCDSSAAYDREVKVPLHARHGVPEVWLADLTKGVVERYRQPGPAGYARAETCRGEDRLAPEGLPEAVLTAREILGPGNAAPPP